MMYLHSNYTVCIRYYSFPKVAGHMLNCWKFQLLLMYFDLSV